MAFTASPSKITQPLSLEGFSTPPRKRSASRLLEGFSTPPTGRSALSSQCSFSWSPQVSPGGKLHLTPPQEKIAPIVRKCAEVLATNPMQPVLVYTRHSPGKALSGRIQQHPTLDGQRASASLSGKKSSPCSRTISLCYRMYFLHKKRTKVYVGSSTQAPLKKEKIRKSPLETDQQAKSYLSQVVARAIQQRFKQYRLEVEGEGKRPILRALRHHHQSLRKRTPALPTKPQAIPHAKISLTGVYLGVSESQLHTLEADHQEQYHSRDPQQGGLNVTDPRKEGLRSRLGKEMSSSKKRGCPSSSTFESPIKPMPLTFFEDMPATPPSCTRQKTSKKTLDI